MTELIFNTNDVAKMLQVDRSTVKRWSDEGKLIVGGAGYTGEFLTSTLSGLFDKHCLHFREFATVQHEEDQ